jgi:hypothetical protein
MKPKGRRHPVARIRAARDATECNIMQRDRKKSLVLLRSLLLKRLGLVRPISRPEGVDLDSTPPLQMLRDATQTGKRTNECTLLQRNGQNGRSLGVLQKSKYEVSQHQRSEAHRLATAIAQETGETMTRMVTEALRERFERLANRRRKALTAVFFGWNLHGTACGFRQTRSPIPDLRSDHSSESRQRSRRWN